MMKLRTSVRRGIVAAVLTLGISGATLGLTQAAAQAAWFPKGIYDSGIECYYERLTWLFRADDARCVALGDGRFQLIVEFR